MARGDPTVPVTEISALRHSALRPIRVGWANPILWRETAKPDQSIWGAVVDFGMAQRHAGSGHKTNVEDWDKRFV